MTPSLYEEIVTRLLDDGTLDGGVVGLVDAACNGAAKLEATLSELQGAKPEARRPSTRPVRATPPGAYLKQLELAGFRGVGPKQKIEFEQGPGLTLILGRNGSGKSSFAEGLETLMTGHSRRWLRRPKDWQSGWRNLHCTAGTFVEATFLVEGSDPVVLRRVWKDGAELDDSELRVRRGSERLAGLESLGWTEPLKAFRPFLSYAELGALLEEPSKLYDELKSILGLEEISEATSVLTEARKERDAERKGAGDELSKLKPRLQALDDPRAKKCLDALSGKVWHLDEVEAAVLGDSKADQQDAAMGRLRRLVQLEVPDLTEIGRAVSALREAIEKRADLARSSEEQSEKLAQVLRAALHYHPDPGGNCPVCERELGSDWSDRARARLEEAETTAKTIRDAVAHLKRCDDALRRMIRSVPTAVQDAALDGFSSEALTAWRVWADAPAEPKALADHADARAIDLVAAVDALRNVAQAKLGDIESAWRPVARDLAAWLATARGVEANREPLQLLIKAEKWMKEAEADLRDARFAPIASRSQSIWALLRQQSNVDLGGVRLEGGGNRRRVALDVSVDGQEGIAVGVMSQGELNALALSLFLPRMTLADSPFHFLVVDDPVQAMDPQKVDGLARVLEDVARTRQVIVLTHDTRLFEAIERLAIKATVFEVGRRAKSVVEISTALDPVERHLKDALDCERHQDKIGAGVAGRTVPGFCRLALEAACVEAVRRRRLGRGDEHADIERAISEAKGVHALAALAIDDDAARGDRVFEYLNNKLDRGAGDAFRAIKEGVHDGYSGSLRDLIGMTRRIASALRKHS
jgi:recombinational DNA repair ATPase RecF